MTRSAALLALLLLVLTGAVASATTVVKLSLDELVKLSDAVVLADVSETESFEKDGKVYTRVELSVVETWKGTVGDKVEIIHIGGRTKNLATRVAGMPTFTKGERSVVFLERPEKRVHYVVTGLTQGKYRVSTSEDGSMTVQAETEVGSLVTPRLSPNGKKLQLKRVRKPTDGVTLTPIHPLPEFRTTIQDLVRKQSEAK